MCAVHSADTLAHDDGFVSHKDTLEETNTLYKNFHWLKMTDDSQPTDSETETDEMGSEGDHRICLIKLYCIIKLIKIYVITVN